MRQAIQVERRGVERAHRVRARDGEDEVAVVGVGDVERSSAGHVQLRLRCSGDGRCAKLKAARVGERRVGGDVQRVRGGGGRADDVHSVDDVVGGERQRVIRAARAADDQRAGAGETEVDRLHDPAAGIDGDGAGEVDAVAVQGVRRGAGVEGHSGEGRAGGEIVVQQRDVGRAEDQRIARRSLSQSAAAADPVGEVPVAGRGGGSRWHWRRRADRLSPITDAAAAARSMLDLVTFARNLR